MDDVGGLLLLFVFISVFVTNVSVFQAFIQRGFLLVFKAFSEKGDLADFKEIFDDR